MSYARKRQILFAVLAVLITLSWGPLRDNFADSVVFVSVLVMIIAGYWGIERLIGKPPADE